MSYSPLGERWLALPTDLHKKSTHLRVYDSGDAEGHRNRVAGPILHDVGSRRAGSIVRSLGRVGALVRIGKACLAGADLCPNQVLGVPVSGQEVRPVRVTGRGVNRRWRTPKARPPIGPVRQPPPVVTVAGVSGGSGAVSVGRIIPVVGEHPTIGDLHQKDGQGGGIQLGGVDRLRGAEGIEEVPVVGVGAAVQGTIGGLGRVIGAGVDFALLT